MIEQANSSILQEVASGSEGALRQLYDLYGRRVYQYVFRLIGDHDDAEDIAIETFTEVWRSAKKFRGDSQVSTWVLGIARNLTMNKLRKNRIPLEELNENLSYEDCIVEKYEAKQHANIIQKALWELPVIHREILDFVFVHDLSYDEIGSLISIPVNTVKTRVFHAKAKLKDVLESMGVNRDDFF